MSDGYSVDVKLYDNVDPRLNRHVLHDSRSWDFRTYMGATPPMPLVGKDHKCHVAPWDQGDLGSCTANAALGMLVTDPFWTPRTPMFTEKDCVSFYHEETVMDNIQIPGVWPPNDTGSCGLYAMKNAQRHGWIKSYHASFGLSAALNTLVDRPVILGLAWYDSMMQVDQNDVVNISPNAEVAGGHEVCAVGLDPGSRLVKIRQSWSVRYGRGGYIYMGFDTLDRLLHEQGDCYTGAK